MLTLDYSTRLEGQINENQEKLERKKTEIIQLQAGAQQAQAQAQAQAAGQGQD